jgi:hypothetical protein
MCELKHMHCFFAAYFYKIMHCVQHLMKCEIKRTVLNVLFLSVKKHFH